MPSIEETTSRKKSGWAKVGLVGPKVDEGLDTTTLIATRDARSLTIYRRELRFAGANGQLPVQIFSAGNCVGMFTWFHILSCSISLISKLKLKL